MEAKKCLMFSEWSLERCCLFGPKDCKPGGQLENPVPCWEETRLRAKAKQLEVLNQADGKIAGSTDLLKNRDEGDAKNLAGPDERRG